MIDTILMLYPVWGLFLICLIIAYTQSIIGYIQLKLALKRSKKILKNAEEILNETQN